MDTLLHVSAPRKLIFSKEQNAQGITIYNVSKVDVTFKLQSTVFGKFIMRPRWGVLKPNEYTYVLITLCKNAEVSKKGRDKILVVCMSAPLNEVDFDSTASFWRHNICYNPIVEKHQLPCLPEQDDTSTADDSVVKSVKEQAKGSSLFRVRNAGPHWR